MRQEMKAVTVYSECDGYSEDEITQNSRSDQPVDLRVSSALERDNIGYKNEISTLKEKPEKNYILASLLTRASSSSTPIKYSASPYGIAYSKTEITDKYESPLSMRNVHLQKVSEYYEGSQSHFQENKISITDKLKIKQGFMDKYPRHKPWNHPNSYGLHSKSTNSSFDIPKDSPTGIGNISKKCDIHVESKPLIDREFVPNYRKFYSRCSNQSHPPTASTERTQEFNPINLDTSCAIIKERLSSSTIAPNPWKYAAYSPPGHLYRLLQRDRTSPNSVPSIKRKMSYLPDTNSNDANRKDKTLKCLLSSSVDDKGFISSANMNRLADQSRDHEKQCDYTSIKDRLKLETCSVSKSETYSTSVHGRCHDVGKSEIYPESLRARCRSELEVRPSHIYCPRAVRAIPGDTVLKSILVSDCKLPAPILPTSGPPSSGSPGSESTSSGSTDSGVFSDNVLDDRRRVTRVLSGRHVKSGTGASITTLRLLRQMIIQRKNRTDRKL